MQINVFPSLQREVLYIITHIVCAECIVGLLVGIVQKVGFPSLVAFYKIKDS